MIEDRFIVTASGQELHLAHPLPGQVDIISIAWALAQTNRFGGHAARPYSVAEHSLLVREIAERELGITDPHGLLAALMHDAHEAYCGDMHTPGKGCIDGWLAWEAHWEHLIRRCFGLFTASAVYRAAIKRADLIALATERRDLVNSTATTPWPVLAGVAPVDWVDLNDRTRRDMRWDEWRGLWLDEYNALDYARNVDLWPTQAPESGAPA